MLLIDYWLSRTRQAAGWLLIHNLIWGVGLWGYFKIQMDAPIWPLVVAVVLVTSLEALLFVALHRAVGRRRAPKPLSVHDFLGELRAPLVAIGIGGPLGAFALVSAWSTRDSTVIGIAALLALGVAAGLLRFAQLILLRAP